MTPIVVIFRKRQTFLKIDTFQFNTIGLVPDCPGEKIGNRFISWEYKANPFTIVQAGQKPYIATKLKVLPVKQ